jgi:glycosyltransferase involved in cell wall biosynthesis
MRIVHIVGGNINGGAGRGALWLHQAQIDLGLDSHLFTLSDSEKVQKFENVYSFPISRYDKVHHSLNRRIKNYWISKIYINRANVIFSTGLDGVNFLSHPIYKTADIIHLHWINSFASINTISKIDKPIVWTLRDMWPFTGGCHISLGCEKFKDICGNCPQLNGLISYDLSTYILKLKRSKFSSKIVFVGISNWISGLAKSSSLLKKHRIETISNNIDTNRFVRIEKKVARAKLNLNTGKKFILIGAEVLTEPWKGFTYFLDSIGYLKSKNIHFLFFGMLDLSILEKFEIEFTYLGQIRDDIILNNIYSAADVFVAPSIYESFGKTIVEAMASGTPVVCFDATGPKDIVEHLITGYKVKPLNCVDLASGIDWVLNLDSKEKETISQNCIERAKRLFDSSVIAAQYLTLYEEMIYN